MIQFENINQSVFQEKTNQENVEILDVRTPIEVAEGFIKGATHFIDVNGFDFTDKIEELDKSKTYLVYCRSGVRSVRACLFMHEAGFTSLFNLEGGISSWTGEKEVL